MNRLHIDFSSWPHPPFDTTTTKKIPSKSLAKTAVHLIHIIDADEYNKQSRK
jgi:hypothetical protein